MVLQSSEYVVEMTYHKIDQSLRKFYFPTTFHLAKSIIGQNTKFRISGDDIGFKIEAHPDDPEVIKRTTVPPPE